MRVKVLSDAENDRVDESLFVDSNAPAGDLLSSIRRLELR
jgi:hypothetical protein